MTLGGYDANRFVPNNVSFELNPSQVPQVYINSISVANTSSSSDLVYATDRVSAIIDSSTPYLWLPKAACDRFAGALGLHYNDSLNLYTFEANNSQHELLKNSSLTFVFSLSDVSASPNIVNISLPYAAFDLELTFPAIPGTSSGAEDSTMFYFPLRQAANETQYTIGRVFLQESYLITDYERNNFSLHQAVHTSAPLQNTSIISISRPSNSNFTGPPKSSNSMKLSTGAIVGIAVGVVVITALLTFALLFLCRRRHRDVEESEKSVAQRTLLDRLRRRRPPLPHEASGDTDFATEVGADATHERFELPAPLGPVELDSESGTLGGTTEHGSSTQDSGNISAYERARRKLERQRSAAARLQQANETYPVEKNETDISPVAHYRPSDNVPDIESPLVSPLGAESGDSLTISGAPSPVSPGFVSAPTSLIHAPPPTYQRINPANVVYAGRLPDNVELPQIVPRLIGPDGRTMNAEPTISDPNSSLGSHYTENENADLYGSGSSGAVDVSRGPESSETRRGDGIPIREELDTNVQIREISQPWGPRRTLDGEDLVHIPQPPENRFSWEEERTNGTD